MTEERSLIENLTHRRVPQIVGMYIAATWLVIELGDWTTERFNFPPNLTSYVFVAMLVMLPALVLFAYNHGAPGKDQWTATERAVIPINALLAVIALYFISPLLIVEAATETVQIPDETGAVQEFEVARQGYHREMVGFFWENTSGDDDLDWLSYGLPLMLAHDLDRVTPVLTAVTPFDSRGMRAELRGRDFQSLLDVPQGLALELARDRRSAALLVGNFSRNGETHTVNVSLINTDNGNEIGAHSFTGNDWLTAVDDVSSAVLRLLEVEPSDNQSNDPVSQHFTASIEAVRHFVNGSVAISISNDFPNGIAEYQQAVELDPAFAEAGRSLSIAHFLSGDVDSARETATQALRNSYRLSETGKFSLKANRYMFDGDYERSARVLDVWTQVQPNSTIAFSELARLSRMSGTEEGLTKASEAYDRLLELDPQDLDVYRQKSQVEVQRGNYDKAANYLRSYLDQDPEDGDVHLQLATIYQAQGDLDAAQAALEDAAILSDDPLASELGLARLEARRGHYEEAEERLAENLTDELGPQQRVQVLSAQSELAVVRGQISRGIEIVNEVNEIAKGIMPPMMRLVSVENQRTGMLALLGETDAAIASIDGIAAQLQPPMSSYMNFTYTTVYAQADDRDGFREWATRTQETQDQLPEIFRPFIEMQVARLAIWDEDFAAAIEHLDRAQVLLSQSFIQTFQNNLSTSSLQVGLAELYLAANEPERCIVELEDLMRVFPGHAHAKLVAAKANFALGKSEAAVQLLNTALEIWSDADENYVHRQEAVELLDQV